MTKLMKLVTRAIAMLFVLCCAVLSSTPAQALKFNEDFVMFQFEDPKLHGFKKPVYKAWGIAKVEDGDYVTGFCQSGLFMKMGPELTECWYNIAKINGVTPESLNRIRPGQELFMPVPLPPEFSWLPDLTIGTDLKLMQHALAELRDKAIAAQVAVTIMKNGNGQSWEISIPTARPDRAVAEVKVLPTFEVVADRAIVLPLAFDPPFPLIREPAHELPVLLASADQHSWVTAAMEANRAQLTRRLAAAEDGRQAAESMLAAERAAKVQLAKERDDASAAQRATEDTLAKEAARLTAERAANERLRAELDAAKSDRDKALAAELAAKGALARENAQREGEIRRATSASELMLVRHMAQLIYAKNETRGLLINIDGLMVTLDQMAMSLAAAEAEANAAKALLADERAALDAAQDQLRSLTDALATETAARAAADHEIQNLHSKILGLGLTINDYKAAEFERKWEAAEFERKWTELVVMIAIILCLGITGGLICMVGSWLIRWKRKREERFELYPG